ncbi:MAG: helicase HerA-like domain-containing protein [Desulfobacterales bacterium]
MLAEGFSRMGVPVFMVDVKGDVSGLAMAEHPMKNHPTGRANRNGELLKPTRWYSGIFTGNWSSRTNHHQ